MSASNSEQNSGNDGAPEWDERLLDYTFGALDQEASAEFERRLLECRERVMLADEYRGVTAILGGAVAPAEPPEGHKARFLAKFAATPQIRDVAPSTPEGEPALTSDAGRDAPRLLAPRGETERETGRAVTGDERIVDITEARRRRQGSLAAIALGAAAAAVILVMGVWLWSLSSSLNDTQRRLADLNTRPNIPPGYTAFPIAAQAPYTATAMVLFNPETKDAYLVANGLEPLPPDKVYEFWLFPSQTASPLPAGTFNADASKVAKHTISAETNVSSYAGFAVSLENAPGGLTPQGPVVLVGFYK